ncbi:gamma-butyrobetaine hydroxylase-like domain-containing protein [Chelativorans xinjiangense]|uniref:gamma-butyrobetaine hydroxylase-like domain-containing protein n=1 Tax=Chelativorans xinjiangense TaxID=2681485 RepID=UPI00135C99E1|nr:gamma-butyrobetaine hydroxylase-like domain-containing protein [Chelativorans xinjiangense]
MTTHEPSPREALAAHGIPLPPPREVRVSTERDRLTLVWGDGRQDVFEARTLRQNCQSAKAKRLRLTGTTIGPAADLAIASVSPIGTYAINIAFSDGHDRGIYPWSFLAELAAGAKAIT